MDPCRSDIFLNGKNVFGLECPCHLVPWVQSPIQYLVLACFHLVTVNNNFFPRENYWQIASLVSLDQKNLYSQWLMHYSICLILSHHNNPVASFLAAVAYVQGWWSAASRAATHRHGGQGLVFGAGSTGKVRTGTSGGGSEWMIKFKDFFFGHQTSGSM